MFNAAYLVNHWPGCLFPKNISEHLNTKIILRRLANRIQKNADLNLVYIPRSIVWNKLNSSTTAPGDCLQVFTDRQTDHWTTEYMWLKHYVIPFFIFFSLDDTFQTQDTKKEGESYKVGLTLGQTWTLSGFWDLFLRVGKFTMNVYHKYNWLKIV